MNAALNEDRPHHDLADFLRKDKIKTKFSPGGQPGFTGRLVKRKAHALGVWEKGFYSALNMRAIA